MSRISTKPPGGTRDLLPADVARRRHVTGVIEQVYERYGFVPIETPAIENLATLLGKYGEEGDQLIFRLLHRGQALGRALDGDEISEADLADQGLRYDLTVPLARFVAEHKRLPRYFKRYQIQPVWRADRPGRGRLREFWQCDVDVIGTTSMTAEAEVCAAVAEVLATLGFERFALRTNHRALLRALIAAAGIAPGLEASALVAVDKLDKIGADGVTDELRGRGVSAASAARLLELLAPGGEGDDEATLRRLRETLPAGEGKRALDELAELLDLARETPAAGRMRLAPELARGLGYYTRPIFEIAVEDLAGSLGGGGRYDELVGMFDKRTIPAVGFSLGLERILLVMEERGLYPELPGGPEILLCAIDVPARRVLGVARRLREQGLRVDVHPGGAKLGKQLQYASELGVPFAAIVGDQELEAGRIALKHLASGEQRDVPLAEAGAAVAGWAG